MDAKTPDEIFRQWLLTTRYSPAEGDDWPRLYGDVEQLVRSAIEFTLAREKNAAPAPGFVECDTCFAKPGTPALCNGCLSNRKTIALLTRALAESNPKKYEACESFAAADRFCADWNARHPVGTRVIRFRLIMPTHDREPVVTNTASKAWVLPSGIAVIAVDGKSGCVALESVMALNTEKAAQ